MFLEFIPRLTHEMVEKLASKSQIINFQESENETD